MLAIPSTILQVPFYIPEGVARGLVYIGFDSPPGQKIFSYVSDESGFISPVLGTGGNGGFGGGVRVGEKNLVTRPDAWSVTGTYSVSQYQSFRTTYSAPTLIEHHLGIALNAAYDFMPREPFFGLGNNSREENETAYTHERSTIRGSVLINARQPLSIRVTGGIEAHNIFDGDDPDHESDLDSLQARFSLSDSDLRPTRYWLAEIGVRHDWRDHPGQTTGGGREDLMVGYYHGFDRSPELQYLQVRADLRQYVELFHSRVVEFRLLAQSIDIINPDDRADNPIYLQSELGGPDGLRGYDPVRFVDEKLALVSVEYRYPLWRSLDAYWFFEEGRVFSSFRDAAIFKNWHYSFGTGLRVWGKSGEVFRLEIAQSKEATRFLFNFGFAG